MVYVNEKYKNYKYFVGASDNYIILTNVSSVNGSFDNPKTYSVIYQYFDPSYINIEETRSTRSSIQFERLDVSTDYWDRPDCSELTTVIFIIVLLLCCIINSITEFVDRGGIMKW